MAVLTSQQIAFEHTLEGTVLRISPEARVQALDAAKDSMSSCMVPSLPSARLGATCLNPTAAAAVIASISS